LKEVTLQDTHWGEEGGKSRKCKWKRVVGFLGGIHTGEPGKKELIEKNKWRLEQKRSPESKGVGVVVRIGPNLGGKES